MKGLLHRLAARAAGTTVPVRSDARLPFGGVDLAWGETVETVAAPVPLVAAPASDPAQAYEAVPPSVQPDDSKHDAPASMFDRQSTPSPRPAPRTDLSSPVPNDARADARSASPTTSLAAPLTPTGQPDPRLPPRLVEGRSPDAMQAPPARAEPRDVPAWRPPATQASPPSPGPDAAIRSNGEPPLPSPPSPGPDAAIRSNGEPPLLMPRATAERAPTPTHMSAAARGPVWPNVAAQAAADEPTEVYIHIGRIEVTAVHEAPAPRTQPKGRQAPMSLDAYLSGRSKT